LKKKTKAGGITIPDFKLYYKESCSHQDSMVLAQKQTDQWNRRENSEMDPQLYGQFISNKAGKNIHWKKVSSTNGVGKTGSNMQKNETGPLCYTIHKNKFKMDERPTCETENHKNPREHRQQPL